MTNETAWKDCYPRPQLRRDSFWPLAGPWTLDDAPIQLPWPPQAPLAGYTGAVGPALRYQTAFCLPDGFAKPGQRVLLHFGAVDQTAQVLCNDRLVAHHEGGYLPFCADITETLLPGENRLTVLAQDTLSPQYPYGKQCARPHGMWYTPVSGIWQPVWLEAVPAHGAVESLRVTPDGKGVTLEVAAKAKSFTVTVTLPAGGPLTVQGCPGQPLRLAIPSPRLWTPEDPWLYDFTVTTDTDCVQSYFALRTVSVQSVGGRARICLNGQPVFLHGVLDQGYFANGLYLPASPDEYEKDIRRVKALGFNTLRKHCKLEPEAFYFACDRLGMLVLQDMVNAGAYHFGRDTAAPTLGLKKHDDRRPALSAEEKARRAFFEEHLRATQRRLYNHPCVIGYTIFNEGWGQYQADRLYRLCRAGDATRFYDSTSGWFAQKESDVQSEHVYFRTKRLRAKSPRRPLLLSECGGFSRRVAGHVSTENKNYGYGTADSEAALTARMLRMYRAMVLPGIAAGLCGCIYTQLSDVEGETNGLYTCDRAVCKVTPPVLRGIAKEIEAAFARAVAGR